MSTIGEVADPDRALALVHVPARVRDAITALFVLDERLGRIVASSREPMLAAIRLAWWREALEALDGAPPPDEPLLRALAEVVDRHGLTGAALAGIVSGWEALPQDGPPEAHGERGAALFAAGARVLGGVATEAIEQAGAGWALVDLAFHDTDRGRAEATLAAARAAFAASEARWPRALRPLGMLAMLARRDAAEGLDMARDVGSARRAARMLAFRWIGR